MLDDVWNDIVATLELGSGLRFAFVEVESSDVRTKLRQRLQRYLKKQCKSLRSPSAGQDPLDWLSHEQTAPGGDPPEETRWLVVPRRGNERFLLHRLNEGRDNLRRHLSGVLFLVGSRGILQRLANDAPDLWSVRELAFDLTEARQESMAKPAKKKFDGAETKNEYDVFLSYSRYDATDARNLKERLEKEGLRVFEASDLFGFEIYKLELLARTGYFICLLSPSYTYSKSLAQDLHWIHLYKRAVFPNRFIPIMVRTTTMPSEIRHLAWLDFRTEKQVEANYPRLLQILKSAAA